VTDPAHGRDIVAVIIAIGVCTAINLVILAVLVDAFYPAEGSGLSENATQIITGGIGGLVGVLGSYVGFRAGTRAGHSAGAASPPSDVSDSDV
jgi:hypothetical protein